VKITLTCAVAGGGCLGASRVMSVLSGVGFATYIEPGWRGPRRRRRCGLRLGCAMCPDGGARCRSRGRVGRLEGEVDTDRMNYCGPGVREGECVARAGRRTVGTSQPEISGDVGAECAGWTAASVPCGPSGLVFTGWLSAAAANWGVGLRA